jgi:hypothetical protein
MKPFTRMATLATALAVTLIPAMALAAPVINSAVVEPRVFNDCPGSLFSYTNNYPALISMTDVNQNCFGFANLHLWRLSSDGATPAEFANADGFRFCADLQLTGNGAAEAGLQIAPWWSQSDGRLNVKTTTGEIAAFGGRLPFYSFSDPAGYDLHYQMGDVIHLEIIYRPNSLTEADPATIEYIVNGKSSGELAFDQGTVAEDPPHGLWGILTPSQVGGYFQFFLNDSGPTGTVTANWTNICYESLGTSLFACPRGLGFWRQQCAQRGNGSTKICQAGLENLWRCLISDTDIIQWQDNGGSFTTTASLMAGNNADLSSELCSQLQGPRPMRTLDKAEIQYLVLQLNICAGALSPGILVNDDFEGTIGAALDSLENAINTGQNLAYWTGVLEDINDNMNLEAEDCPNPDSLFRNVAPCTAEDHDGNSTRHEGFDGPGLLETRALPNPVVGGSTSISFRVPETSGPASVDVAVYDLSGRLVRTLVSDSREPGAYSVDWDLRNESGTTVSSGIYFYRVAVGDTQVTQKLLIAQ